LIIAKRDGERQTSTHRHISDRPLVELAALHDDAQVFVIRQHGNVSKRLAIHNQQIGQRTFANTSESA